MVHLPVFSFITLLPHLQFLIFFPVYVFMMYTGNKKHKLQLIFLSADRFTCIMMARLSFLLLYISRNYLIIKKHLDFYSSPEIPTNHFTNHMSFFKLPFSYLHFLLRSKIFLNIFYSSFVLYKLANFVR